MTVLHGDDTIGIRTALHTLVSHAKNTGSTVLFIDAKKLTRTELESVLGTQDLFSEKKTIVVERLHGLPKSKAKDELIGMITSYEGPSELILVEEKILTPAQIKKFGNATVKLFRLPQILFSFLETLGTIPSHKSLQQFQQIIATQESELVFSMLVRQIRLLLFFVCDGTYSGPPFAKQKLEKQANRFTQEKLLQLHTRLLEIDTRQKTSTNSLTLSQEIDLFILSL